MELVRADAQPQGRRNGCHEQRPWGLAGLSTLPGLTGDLISVPRSIQELPRTKEVSSFLNRSL